MPQTGAESTDPSSPIPATPANPVVTPAAAVSPSLLAVLPPSGRHRLALRAARAFCEALFSQGGQPPPRERMDWLLGELDDLISRAGWRSGGFYKLALLVVNFLSPLLIGRPIPLWRLNLDQRVRALRAMEHSFLAALVLAVKSIICIIYYEHPDALGEIGYAPECHGGKA